MSLESHTGICSVETWVQCPTAPAFGPPGVSQAPFLEPPWPRGRSGGWERRNQWLSNLNMHPEAPGGLVKTDRWVHAQPSIAGSLAQGWGPECAWLTSCRARLWLLAWGPHPGSQWAGGTQILGSRDTEWFHAVLTCATPPPLPWMGPSELLEGPASPEQQIQMRLC